MDIAQQAAFFVDHNMAQEKEYLETLAEYQRRIHERKIALMFANRKTRRAEEAKAKSFLKKRSK